MKDSPFYFDKEMHSEEIMVTAHPNTILNRETGEWVEVPLAQAMKGETDNPTNTIEKKNSKGEIEVMTDTSAFNGPYREKPLARAILMDELQVSIANNWSEFGGDPMGQLWEQVRPLAPYADVALKALGGMSKAIENWSPKDGTPDSGFTDLLHKYLLPAITKGGTITESGKKFLQRSLVTQGTRFTYYGGTGIDFNGNFTMKYHVFADWMWDDKEKKFKFKTVYDQLEELIPYVVGDFVPFDSEFIKDMVKDSSQFIKDGADSLSETLAKHVWWQLPPGGYESNLKYIDGTQKGTFKLRVGTHYSIENLVIASAQFNLSKNMTKYPSAELDKTRATSSDNNKITPMSCEVTLQFKPSTKFSSRSLKRYLSGDASKHYLSTYERTLRDNLSRLKEGGNSYPATYTNTKEDLSPAPTDGLMEKRLNEQLRRMYGGGTT